MTDTSRAQKIEAYSNAYPVLVEALRRFPQEMWQFKPSRRDFSIHEIIVHIADSEANSYTRCRRCIAEPGRSVMAYDENLWAQALAYSEQSAEESLELFKCLRRSSYHLIRNLPEHLWSNTIDHPENGVMTLNDWLNIYERHIPEHIEQMEKVYQAWQATSRS
jgi:hypothetical protein